MRIVVMILFAVLLTMPGFGQEKITPTLSSMKKDLTILILRKDVMELKYKNLTITIKQLKAIIEKAEARFKRKAQPKEPKEEWSSSE